MEHDLKIGDFLSGLGLAILGAYILYAASQWTLFNDEGPGPGFFPLIYGVIMMGSALVLTCQAVTRESRPGPARTATEKANRAAALWTWVALAASLPLMWLLGFVVGFGLVLFFIIKVVFHRTVLQAAISAGAITITLHLIFPMLLGVPLPPGKFWSF